jgi:translation initiation factor IF-1
MPKREALAKDQAFSDRVNFSKFLLVRSIRAGMMSRSLKMSERETILLDALLEDVIEPHAFRAVLGNGHRFTAYIAVRDRGKPAPENGNRVKVEISPYNMNAGRIVI